MFAWSTNKHLILLMSGSQGETSMQNFVMWITLELLQSMCWKWDCNNSVWFYRFAFLSLISTRSVKLHNAFCVLLQKSDCELFCLPAMKPALLPWQWLIPGEPKGHSAPQTCTTAVLSSRKSFKESAESLCCHWCFSTKH